MSAYGALFRFCQVLATILGGLFRLPGSRTGPSHENRSALCHRPLPTAIGNLFVCKRLLPHEIEAAHPGKHFATRPSGPYN
jgi:hypothetical protein